MMTYTGSTADIVLNRRSYDRGDGRFSILRCNTYQENFDVLTRVSLIFEDIWYNFVVDHGVFVCRIGFLIANMIVWYLFVSNLS